LGDLACANQCGSHRRVAQDPRDGHLGE
jgi:hypothetical protein